MIPTCYTRLISGVPLEHEPLPPTCVDHRKKLDRLSQPIDGVNHVPRVCKHCRMLVWFDAGELFKRGAL